MAFKLFGSLTFSDFINSNAKAQIDGVVTEALEMVKDDYSDVDVVESKYGYKQGENDRTRT